MRMRRILTYPVLLATLLVAAPAPTLGAEESCTGRPSETKLYVKVSNVQSDKGLIAVTLYADDSRKFLAKRGSLYVGRVPAVAPLTSVCIHVPAPGIYALAVYHDENADRKFGRKGLLGLPAEGFGFSNDPPVFFGMPSFKGVRLNVRQSGLQTTIKLRYP